jgi:hypothetical protein
MQVDTSAISFSDPRFHVGRKYRPSQATLRSAQGLFPISSPKIFFFWWQHSQLPLTTFLSDRQETTITAQYYVSPPPNLDPICMRGSDR